MFKHSVRQHGRRARGTAMLLVLIAVAMCTIMALSFLAAQEPTAVVASNIDRKTQARAIAESALKMAIDYVNEDADWRSDKSSGVWMSDIALDGGTFTLAGTDEDDGDLSDDSSEAVLLTVVASYDGVTHRVSALVRPGVEASSTNRLLLVAGNGNSPSSTDRNKQDLFESWGYVVTIIDDSASTSTYNDAVAVNDVVFVSEEVNSGSVSTKLRNVTIGVVFDEPYLHDDFGFSSSNSGTGVSSDSIDIVDNTHPITEGFSVGSLTYYSSLINVRYITGAMPSGITVLADRTGSGTDVNFAAADVGDALRYGAAEGRRVMFLSTGDLNVNNLNADGQTLLQRSLSWAAGADATEEGPAPTLLALYEFEQVEVAPTLAGRWPLDEQPTNGLGGISAGDEIEMKDSARIDTYDSSAGTYASQTPGASAVVTLNSTSSGKFKMDDSSYIAGDGYIGPGGNTSSVFDIESSATLAGSQLVLSEEVAMTTLSAPSGMPSSSGDLERSSGNLTISSDKTYGEFELKNSATVTISGAVTIWVKDKLKLDDDSEIIVPSGSSLTLYTADDLDVEGDAKLNGDSSGPDRVTIYAYGEKHVDLKDDAVMSAIVYTNDDFHIKDDTHFYGKVLADEEVKMEGNSRIHLDISLGGFSSGGAGVTVGETGNGNGSSTAENDAVATQVTFAEATQVTTISARLKHNKDGYYRYAIYEDDSGSPGDLVAQTGKQSFDDNGWKWQTSSIGPVDLDAGTYWLALSIEGDSGSVQYRYSSGGTSRDSNMNAVDDGFDDPWGSGSSMSQEICIYATGTTTGGSAPETTVDTSDLANDGTTNGEPTAGVTGQHGTAFDFDGDDDYIEIPHHDSYLMQGGTFSVWFKTDKTSGRQGLFSKDSSSYDTGGHFSVFLDGDRIEVRMQSTTQSYYVYSPSSSIQTGTWYHIMFAWGEEGMALYLDGVLVDDNTYTGGLGTTSGGIGNYEPIVLGGNAWQSGDLVATPVKDHFDGTLDDLRIYNERLTESQAFEIFNGAIEPSPFQSESIVEDTSGYGDPLTLSITQTDEVTWADGSVSFDGDAHATSLLPATKLHDAIEATGAFAVEVVMQRATPGTTASPSRIISYADGANAHSFMLGQDDDHYEARVRDTATGTNGTLSPEFISDSSLSGGDTHIVLSYNEGEVSVFIDGVLDETNTAGGVLNNWDDDFYLIFGGAYGGGNHWQGTLKRVAIYDNAFNAIQANNVFNGSDPGSGASGVTGTGSVQWDEQD